MDLHGGEGVHAEDPRERRGHIGRRTMGPTLRILFDHMPTVPKDSFFAIVNALHYA
jgi:hypothetical protein